MKLKKEEKQKQVKEEKERQVLKILIEKRKRRLEDFAAGKTKSQKRKKQIARKAVKSPAAKKKKTEIKENESIKSHEKEEEVYFAPPIIPYEDLKKIYQENKHREELKSFLLMRGFNTH